ncbi:MAG: 23S rRNA methyltransferase [endosymbiont of Galathealinum brachiosum]|uniref:23S rRNA methyltransferase n=1 Tax=endosymbiont of Galathealinum brachiosum TaxID=2200906 RepID=A0A370DGL3_9GAMM|nr:MAG: 23S rRNA methyltransferase [endosymbiont of Galathealinum brachiosum]
MLKEKLQVCIGLCNPKSPDNVNSVRRAAGNYRVDAIFHTGSRYLRALRKNPDTPNINRSVSLNIPVKGVEDLIDQVSEGMQVVCVEFAEGATPLPSYQHPERALYIFGPEDGNISQKIIDRADAVVYVPTVGCMNLAATVNVLLYDRLTKSDQCFDNHQLILENRDTNNNLKFKKQSV